jgi:hypothetical protein
MPLSPDQRRRLTADQAVFTGWLTDVSIDRARWLAMDVRVSSQLYAAVDPDAESRPLFDLQGATVGTSSFHGRPCLVLQNGSRQLVLSSADAGRLAAWHKAFELCAVPVFITSPPVSLSNSILRGAADATPPEAPHCSEKGAVFRCHIPPRFSCMRRLRAYATTTTLLLLGEVELSDHQPAYRALRFDRTVSRPASLREIVREHAASYSAAEAVTLIRGMFRAADIAAPGDDGQHGHSLLPHRQGSPDDVGSNSSNSQSDTVFIVDLAAVLGVIQLSRGFYLIGASRKTLAGMIGGHCVYSIAASELLPISLEQTVATRSTWQRFQGLLTGSDPAAVAEGRYHSLLLSFDLTKDFYYSYT